MGVQFTKANLRRIIEIAQEFGATVEVAEDAIRILPNVRIEGDKELAIPSKTDVGYDLLDLKK